MNSLNNLVRSSFHLQDRPAPGEARNESTYLELIDQANKGRSRSRNSNLEEISRGSPNSELEIVIARGPKQSRLLP